MVVQIISSAVGLLGLFIAFLSFSHHLTKSRREEHEALITRMEAMNERLSADVSRLYDRVGQLEGKTFSTLLDRLATMEGELKIIADIVRMGKGAPNAK